MQTIKYMCTSKDAATVVYFLKSKLLKVYKKVLVTQNLAENFIEI